MNKIFYICQRNGQCVRPCDENCLYTSDFFKSKMYHDSVKRIDTIPFLADKQGDIWEVDMTWDKNLPKELRQVPELMVGYKYETLEKWEMEKKWKTLEKIAKRKK